MMPTHASATLIVLDTFFDISIILDLTCCSRLILKETPEARKSSQLRFQGATAFFGIHFLSDTFVLDAENTITS
jgi:hypothetical protein